MSDPCTEITTLSTPDTRPSVLISNPGSRGGKSAKLTRRYLDMLEKCGIAVTRHTTKDLDDAYKLAKGAAETGASRIIVVGGDGTISKVINGIMASGKKNVELGVLYSGTSPDFCKFHSIPTDPVKAVETLVKGNRHAVDIGRIEMLGGETRYFGCSVNIGLGYDIAARSNRIRPYLGDFIGTLLAAVSAIATNFRSDHTLMVDGKEFTLNRTLNLTIGKNPYLASGLKLNVDTNRDCGKLYLFGIQNITPFGLLLRLPLFYTGKTDRSKAFSLKTAQSIEFISPPHQMEFDGDPHDLSPMTVEIMPKALNLICGGSQR